MNGGPLRRLLVDGRVLDDRYHGIGRTTQAILRALPQAAPDLEVEVLVHSRQRSTRFPLAEAIEANGARRLLFDHPLTSPRQWAAWPRLLSRTTADAVLLPYHLAGPIGPRRGGGRGRSTRTPRPDVFTIVHDCIIEADPGFAPDRRTRLLYPLVTRAVLAGGVSVLTPSAASAREIAHRYGVQVPDEHVIGWGVEEAFTRLGVAPSPVSDLPAGVPARYLLHVGARRPHKDVETAVRALTELDDDVHLVLVGSGDPRWDDPVPAVAAGLGVAHRVLHLSSVSEEQLRALYSHAHAFVYPSLVEGFGLPLLEAMAARVPVVASDVPVFREIAGDAVGYFTPRSPGELAAAVRRLDDAAARARALDAGSALAAAATWEASVTKLLRAMGVSAPEDVAGVHGCGPDLISAPHPPHAPPVPPTTRPQRRG